MKKNLVVMVIVLLMLAATGAFAGAPPMIKYQGRLLDSEGVAVHGIRSIALVIYNVPSGGSPLWNSGPKEIEVTNGLFNFILEDGTPPLSSLDWEPEDALYIQVTVEGIDLLPRERITSAVYTLNAAEVQGRSAEELIEELVPSGAIAIFLSACPTGWTRVSDLDGRFVRGGTAYGATGGSATYTHTYSGTTDPPSTTTVPGQDGSHTSARYDVGITYSGTTGGASSLPPYMDVVFCRRD